MRNIILGIGSFIIFILLVQLIFVKTQKQSAFDYQQFVDSQVTFEACATDFDTIQNQINDYIETVRQTPADEMKQIIYDIIPDTQCNVDYVKSNDDQIREMAQKVLEKGQEIYQSKDVKLLDAVYANDQRMAAYLQNPQSYLFFALPANQEKMMAVVVTPTKQGYDIQEVWELEKASDKDYVQDHVNRLLFLFSEKVF